VNQPSPPTKPQPDAGADDWFVASPGFAQSRPSPTKPQPEGRVREIEGLLSKHLKIEGTDDEYAELHGIAEAARAIASLPAAPTEIDQRKFRELMETCGYDSAKVHPECYLNFSWVRFSTAIAAVYAPAAPADGEVVVALRDALIEYQRVLKWLGRLKDGKTLFEGSPTKDQECFEAWTALDRAGKQAITAISRLHADGDGGGK
jgi:hypothetical protein